MPVLHYYLYCFGFIFSLIEKTSFHSLALLIAAPPLGASLLAYSGVPRHRLGKVPEANLFHAAAVVLVDAIGCGLCPTDGKPATNEETS